MKLFGQPVPFRRRRSERGVTIFLLAVGMAFIILAVSALAIDLVAMYTARGEARLAAEAAALAGARVLATSGVTTDPSATRISNAETLATTVATGVATKNLVGGRATAVGEVVVTFPNDGNLAAFSVNPQVSVVVRRTDVPTFFARAWGTLSVSVSGTAIAEAYNPSRAAAGSTLPPLAPQCVKPWLVPNIDPNNAPNGFFNPASGAITSGTVGEALTLMYGCSMGACAGGLPTTLTQPGTPGSPGPPVIPPTPPTVLFFPANFTAPANNSWPPTCTPACAYEETIVGCSPQPITCGVTSNAIVQLVSTGCAATRSNQTYNGTRCLIHAAGVPTDQDQLDALTVNPTRIKAGHQNPLVLESILAADDHIWTSDSLVTIPVYDNTVPSTPVGSTQPVNVIGFIQGFITNVTDPATSTIKLKVTVMNLSGCGTPSTTASPIVGDGVSAVPVHLISQ
jgi:Flp pilus assembly protein TadG